MVELVTNGDFTTTENPATGWTATSGETFEGTGGRGRLTYTEGAGLGALQLLTVESGKTYDLVIDGFTGTAGDWKVDVLDVAQTGYLYQSGSKTTNSSISTTFVADGASCTLLLGHGTLPAPGEYSEFDNVSVEINMAASMAKVRLGLYGGPRQVYGNFARTAAVVTKDRVTRLGLYGGPRQVYGNHSPKAPAEVVTTRWQRHAWQRKGRL